MKNNNIPKIIQDFEKEFGNLIWSHEFDYVISESDLKLAHHIFNVNIFNSKLDENLKFTIVPYNGQLGKGSFRFGDPTGKGLYIKQDFKFVQNQNDNFFKIMCVLAHEMIHQYDFNFGYWSKLTNKLQLMTNVKLKKQTVGNYDIHNNILFNNFMKNINSYGFNVQKLYSLKDKTFMKKIIETDVVDSFEFFEELDEAQHDIHLTIDKVKQLYNALDSDDDINLVTKPTGAWMIEVF